MEFSKLGVRVLVQDFQKCFDFYTEKLGLKVHWGDRNGPFASFTSDDSDTPVLSMFLAENMSIYDGYSFPIGNGVVDNVVYVIPTDNIDKDYEQLKTKGVSFIGEPQTIKEWYMRCVYFRDPEGNLFELCQDGAE